MPAGRRCVSSCGPIGVLPATISWSGVRRMPSTYVFGLAKNSRLITELAAAMDEAKRGSEHTQQAARVFKEFTYPRALEPGAPGGGQSRALARRRQPALHRHLAEPGALGSPDTLRGLLRCPRREGEPQRHASSISSPTAPPRRRGARIHAAWGSPPLPTGCPYPAEWALAYARLAPSTG